MIYLYSQVLRNIIWKKIRTIITQDAEVDDQNSLRHFLFYANEADLQGIVQTSLNSTGMGFPGAVKPEKKKMMTLAIENGPYDEEYRWTGTEWMFKVIDDYEKDYPNLCTDDGHSTPDYLRSIKGRLEILAAEGEMEKPSDGSELIRERILR